MITSKRQGLQAVGGIVFQILGSILQRRVVKKFIGTSNLINLSKLKQGERPRVLWTHAAPYKALTRHKDAGFSKT